MGACDYPSHIRDYDIEVQRVEPTEEDMKNGVFKINLLLHPHYMRFRVEPEDIEQARAKVYKKFFPSRIKGTIYTNANTTSQDI